MYIVYLNSVVVPQFNTAVQIKTEIKYSLDLSISLQKGAELYEISIMILMTQARVDFLYEDQHLTVHLHSCVIMFRRVGPSEITVIVENQR